VFAGALGPTGPAGPQGPGGELRIYGDGSGGARSIAGFASLDDEANVQFTDLTIEAGAQLFVASGTVIRCTGTFTNNGVVFVGGAAGGGMMFAPSTGSFVASDRPAHPGVSLAAAGNGEQTDNIGNTVQGSGGVPVSEHQARRLLAPGILAGGGGGIARSANGGSAGDGGGALVILAGAAIVNNGQISANFSILPSSCAGGGAGGILILASRGAITNNGALRAQGGSGGASSNDCGPGGGGGGGIVHLLAPAVNVGVVSVTGGTPGATGPPGSVNQTRRSGGGGGGACGGRGGAGGAVFGADPMDASAGDPGLSLQSQLDPTSLF
jgi:hypothetical protein